MGNSNELEFKFEYEINNKNFNLYQRGGDDYITMDCNGKIRGNISLNNSELNMLYPVAKVDFMRQVKESFKDAFAQFLQRFHPDVREDVVFKFSLKNLRDANSENLLKGTPKINRKDSKIVLESISYEP